MRLLLADDEPQALARLKSLIGEISPEIEVVAEAANGTEALALCQHQVIDMALLDIRMPGLDGIALATELALLPRPPAIIFLTAYDEYALKAFEANAIDYLLKPVRKERLHKALEKAKVLNAGQLQSIENTTDYVTATYRGGLKKIPFEEILFFRADSKYVEVVTPGGTALLDVSLKALEERFGDRLMRVHRNALIVPRHAKELRKGKESNMLLSLSGTDELLEVSRRHLPDVRRLLK